MQEQHITRMLNDIAEEHIPATVNLWPDIQAQAQSRLQRSRQRWQQRSLALAAMLVLTLIATFNWIGRPPAVSAEAILQQAQVVAEQPSAGGVDSFMMTQEISWTRLARWLPENVEPTQEDQETIIMNRTVYFQVPNLTRRETDDVQILRGRNAFGDGPEVSESLSVSDGVNYWTYIPEHNRVDEASPDSAVSNAFELALYPSRLQMAQFANINNALMECYEPRLEGSQVVAERDSWMINLGQATGCLPDTIGGEQIGGVRVWVDKETHFILKTVMYEVPNERVLYEAEVTHIEYNVPLDPALFTFTPPSDAIIQEVGKPSSLDPGN
jgi:outer membrane lipoprotein-sorting protein